MRGHRSHGAIKNHRGRQGAFGNAADVTFPPILEAVECVAESAMRAAGLADVEKETTSPRVDVELGALCYGDGG